jgi:hypothetical protein
LILHVEQDSCTQWVVASPSEPSIDVYVQDARTLVWYQEKVTLDDIAQNLAAGDFDGDGILDLVVSGDHFVTTLISASGRQPFFSQNIATESAANVMIVKDFNEDGLDDIAILAGDEEGDSLQVLYSLGDGSFTQSPIMLCSSLAPNEIQGMETKSKRLASCLRAKLLP